MFSIGTGGTTSMLLITDYHPLGSLYDFLKYNEINEEEMVRNHQKKNDHLTESFDMNIIILKIFHHF